MFIAALFTMAKIWKQPKCPSTQKWIKKRWHTYTMEYYSAIKKRMKVCHLQPHGQTWRVIMLSKIKQRKTYTVFYHLYLETKKIKQTSKYKINREV